MNNNNNNRPLDTSVPQSMYQNLPAQADYQQVKTFALNVNVSLQPPSAQSYYWTASHAIGGNESRITVAQQEHEQQQQDQQQQDIRIGTALNQNTIAPPAAHRPSLPQTLAKPEATAPGPAPAPESNDPRIIMMPVCPLLQSDEYKAEMEAAQAALASSDEGPRPLTASGHPACSMCGVSIV